MNATLQARFADMLSRHGIVPSRSKGMVGCIFHGPERTPSLSIDLEKCVFYCFGCGVGGGVRNFATLVGEPWAATRADSHAKARWARLEAERQARAILQRREDERLDALFTELRDSWRQAAEAAGVLKVFHRRPERQEEFLDVVAEAEREYGEAVSRLAVLEAQI